MNLIDTHFHLDFYKNHYELNNIINEYRQYTICVTNSPEIYLSCNNLYSQTKYLKFALGYNPKVSHEIPFNKKAFQYYIADAAYIGEVGLDYTKKHITSEREQKSAFEFICKQASIHNKLMSVHTRMAEKDVLSILAQFKVQKAIIHWYTGSTDLIKDYIDAGYYFSVNTNMCTTKSGLCILKAIPRNRLLIESDGPFTKVDSMTFSPQLLQKVYYKISDCLEVKHLDNIVFENFNRLLTK